MSLEHFKTQILLLHSEQSTLDNFCTGFNDRYTVHCATSGSEALHTLGDTEIDVIVTAQDLPGMSGLDALREAKKRSPNTIGILIAGKADGDLEAIVGDQEVFQIVRGGVSPAALKELVDNATRQSRLLTLAESANDTSAAVDEPIGEHIVMETAENGSSIISDGTGRIPVLNPDKVAAQTNLGSRSIDVLVLTKDEEFLTTVKESGRGTHNVIFANTLAQADDAVRNHKVGVAVVDAAMVGSNVEKLVAHLRSTEPRLVAIVAGRRDDGEMLMDLINRGKVYRFLLKPVSPGRARLAIEASVKQHLEAPDAAFKSAGTAAPAKAVPQKRKAQSTVARKPAGTVRKAQARSNQSGSAPKITVGSRRVPPSADLAAAPDDRLSGAFGDSDSRLTDTIAGLMKTIGNTLSSAKAFKKAGIARAVQVAGAASGGSQFPDRKTLGVGATTVAILLSVGWWLFGSSVGPAPTEQQQPQAGAPLITESDPVYKAPAKAEPDLGVQELLEEARLAASAGQIYNPPGSNAIELYFAAANAAPNDVVIAEELVAVTNQALAMAESSMLDKRVDDAYAALQRVALADPDNGRLPFLTEQLSQMQLRDLLDSVRIAIRENRLEDATVALEVARTLDVNGGSEIDAIANDLSSALSEQRVDDVLLKANARLDEGKLTAPSNDNARYYFELALSKDPDNAAARQGLGMVASKLVLQARAEIDTGQLEAADILLADAHRLDPASSELIASISALDTARVRLRQDELDAAEAAAAEQAEAERLAAEQLAFENQASAPQEIADESSPETAIPTVRLAPVSISSLTRTKYVAPKYPRAAQRRSINGWVDVAFTVDFDGSVKDIEVRDSNPGVTFVNAAVSAVEDWEFEPIVENDEAIQKRAAVRMLFAIE